MIVYRIDGVCRVDAIGLPDLPSSMEIGLIPINRDGKYILPVDTAVFMRPVITYEKAQHLLEQIPHIARCMYSWLRTRLPRCARNDTIRCFHSNDTLACPAGAYPQPLQEHTFLYIKKVPPVAIRRQMPNHLNMNPVVIQERKQFRTYFS